MECAICLTLISELPDKQNGELLCQECYEANKEVIKDG